MKFKDSHLQLNLRDDWSIRWNLSAERSWRLSWKELKCQWKCSRCVNPESISANWKSGSVKVSAEVEEWKTGVVNDEVREFDELMKAFFLLLLLIKNEALRTERIWSVSQSVSTGRERQQLKRKRWKQSGGESSLIVVWRIKDGNSWNVSCRVSKILNYCRLLEKKQQQNEYPKGN